MPPERRVPRRPLTAGIDLTRVGLDLGSAVPPADGDQETARACVRAAVGAGINWIDAGSAPQTQTLAGDALAAAGLPPCALVASIPAPARDADTADVVASVAERLRADRVDVLLVEGETAPADEAWRSLRELVADGRAGAVGLRNPTAEVLLTCQERGGVDVVGIEVGLSERAAIRDLLTWCVSTGTDVLARGRLAVPPSPSVSEALRSAELRHGNPADVVLVAWVLAWPGITAVAFPASTAGEVDRRVDAAQLKLGSEDLDAIAAALRADGLDDEGFERPRTRG